MFLLFFLFLQFTNILIYYLWRDIIIRHGACLPYPETTASGSRWNLKGLSVEWTYLHGDIIIYLYWSFFQIHQPNTRVSSWKVPPDPLILSVNTKSLKGCVSVCLLLDIIGATGYCLVQKMTSTYLNPYTSFCCNSFFNLCSFSSCTGKAQFHLESVCTPLKAYLLHIGQVAVSCSEKFRAFSLGNLPS